MVASGDQGFGKMRADEAPSSCDKAPHAIAPASEWKSQYSRHHCTAGQSLRLDPVRLCETVHFFEKKLALAPFPFDSETLILGT
jgi:hypothetical protein